MWLLWRLVAAPRLNEGGVAPNTVWLSDNKQSLPLGACEPRSYRLEVDTSERQLLLTMSSFSPKVRLENGLCHKSPTEVIPPSAAVGLTLTQTAAQLMHQ